VNERDLGELLSVAVADPPPSRVIDLERVHRDGSRTLMRRRTLTSIAAALAVAAVVAVAATVVRDGAPIRPGPTPAEVSPTAAPPAPPAAPVVFDPSRLRVVPQWIPAGLDDTLQRVSTESHEFSYVHWRRVGDEFPLRTVSIAVYASGVEPPDPELRAVRESTAPPERGPGIGTAPSTWYPDVMMLKWRWATGAWAEVRVRGAFDRPNREVAVRIARNLRTDADGSVTVPFTVPAPPVPLRLVETLVGRHDNGYEAQLVFSDRDHTARPGRPVPHLLVIGVQADASRKGDGKVGEPHTTIGGHPAIVTFAQGWGGRVMLFDVDDHRVDVYAGDEATLRYIQQPAAIALARGVRIVPNPRDPSSWTSTPIR